MFVIFGLVDAGFLMTMDGAPAGRSPGASLAAPTIAFAALNRPWRRAALFLAGTSQLITIQAPASADPMAVSRWCRQALARAGFARKKCEQMSFHPGSRETWRPASMALTWGWPPWTRNWPWIRWSTG